MTLPIDPGWRTLTKSCYSPIVLMRWCDFSNSPGWCQPGGVSDRIALRCAGLTPHICEITQSPQNTLDRGWQPKMGAPL